MRTAALQKVLLATPTSGLHVLARRWHIRASRWQSSTSRMAWTSAADAATMLLTWRTCDQTRDQELLRIAPRLSNAALVTLHLREFATADLGVCDHCGWRVIHGHDEESCTRDRMHDALHADILATTLGLMAPIAVLTLPAQQVAA